MISREEKNKKYIDEINKEKTISITKKILKVFGVILIIFTLIFLYSYYYESNKYEIKEYLINDSSIPNDFNGIKILHLTDTLYGSNVDKEKLEYISEDIKLINPDIVLFTGNIINKDYVVNEEDIKILNNFFNNIPYTIGKYAISGDLDSQNFNLIFDNTNFIILNNELTEIFNGKEKIDLIGISYNNTKEIKSNDNYTITIINNYDDYDKLNITSNLVFAGHNLGGEIRPFNIPLLGTDKHLDSYYEENNTKIYISNGLGSIHHLRLMNKPSMNVYRLYK